MFLFVRFRAVSEPAVHPDSERQEDEEEEDSPLCDPEEMDLLGEIFDALGSRSSHERGLLYGTRSLDLFAPDSQDYITKGRFPANPSQESLSLSISGSLHSWNPETTEEPSDLTEDSDWLCLDTGAPEEEGTDGLLAECEVGEQEIREREVREEQEEVKVATNGNQEEEIDDGRNNCEEVRLEVKTEGREEKRASLGEDPGKEMADERLRGMEVQNPNGEVEKETREMQKNKAREEEEKETQEEKGKEVTLNTFIKPIPFPLNPEEDNPKPTAPPGPRSLIVEPPAQRKRREEAVAKEEQEKRQSPSPPKELPAGARFQSPASRTAEPAGPGRPCSSPCDSDAPEERRRSEGHEDEDPPPSKVSELKKRFEA
ncbi:hypothetical protein EYF80_018754 [Liparis tanakae]|uniref:Uncharacterized protein n=1 Tax=Liparis tanakae TaxID=230148 RepID=A0A4Z2HZ43_9TELE|nr:hypothetical protein EYF80_018754 [Liparis tanakae]